MDVVLVCVLENFLYSVCGLCLVIKCVVLYCKWIYSKIGIERGLLIWSFGEF